MNTAVVTNWWDELPQADSTHVENDVRIGKLIVDGIVYSASTVGTFTWNAAMVRVIDDHPDDECDCWS